MSNNEKENKRNCFNCDNFNQHYAIAPRGKRFMKINCGNCIARPSCKKLPLEIGCEKYKEREEVPKRIREGIEKSLASMSQAVCEIAEVVNISKTSPPKKNSYILVLLPLFRSPLPKNRQPQSLNLSLRNHCSKVARCISFAFTRCYCRKKPTGAISLAPIRPSLRSCLFPATSFLPISPSLRESNAKRYDRGNPNHKNDRQTVLSFRLEVFRHLFSHSASLSALTSTFGFSAMTTGQLFLHFASLSVLTSKKGF